MHWSEIQKLIEVIAVFASRIVKIFNDHYSYKND